VRPINKKGGLKKEYLKGKKGGVRRAKPTETLTSF
jgi:hypothetical protein